jgi:hypothetical protein
LERVWVNQGNPSKVIDAVTVHYFFWRIETGITTVKIRSLTIPILPIKLLDYEPVKVVQVEDELQVLSRFHYRILLYFNQPELVQNKPIVDFMLGSHSPYVHSVVLQLGSVIRLDEMDPREISAFEFLKCLYYGMISGKITTQGRRLRDYSPVSESIPPNLVFNLASMKAVIWVGRFPQPSDVPSDLRPILFPALGRIVGSDAFP